ncbi:ADP-ribosylglycohydrolase family protein [Falsiroseomonas sp. HW251]|uniref:ADP-ribosylglycohydrolase family protein n=1 Tax=Falsiroseomonas sp. HW251 TaxID=3390998 RepID=UPI003D319A16
MPPHGAPEDDVDVTQRSTANRPDRLTGHAEACLVFGIVGDAMGTPSENLTADTIAARFGRIETFTGTGTDDTIMRDLLADALIATEGRATADDWARQWLDQAREIFGVKVGKFFPSVLHAARKLSYDYLPRLVHLGNMPSSSSAMAISPVGIVNAANPTAAASQAFDIAGLIHGGEVGFCQDAAASLAAAIAAALAPGATLDDAMRAAEDAIRPWSGGEMRGLVRDAIALARDSGSEAAFRAAYQARFSRVIACDSRETVPAALGISILAAGDPWLACVIGANFGRDADTIACMAGGLCGALGGMPDDIGSRLDPLPPDARALQRDRAEALVRVARMKAARELAAWQRAAAL